MSNTITYLDGDGYLDVTIAHNGIKEVLTGYNYIQQGNRQTSKRLVYFKVIRDGEIPNLDGLPTRCWSSITAMIRQDRANR